VGARGLRQQTGLAGRARPVLTATE
jgi:hypothetical protein